jgi:hypothetical protein
MIFVILALALAALALHWLREFVTQGAALASLPTPPVQGGLISRLLGHSSQLLDPRSHHTILKWSLQLGPIFLLRVAWIRAVLITDPVLIHAILKKTRDQDKCPMTYSTVNQVRGHFGTLLFVGLLQTVFLSLLARNYVRVHTTDR